MKILHAGLPVVVAAATFNSLIACGNSSSLTTHDGGGVARSDASPSLEDAASTGGDAGSEAGTATATPEAGSGACDLGSVASLATDQSLNIFGQVVYYADGGALPAGEYRVSYLDGCMKYSSAQGWTVNAYQGDPDSWWLVGATTDDRIVVPPGTVGYAVDAGAFADFDACVAASQLAPPVDFQFDGGPIGVWLEDNPYSDNVAGPDGRNPTWDLTLIQGACPVAAAP